MEALKAVAEAAASAAAASALNAMQLQMQSNMQQLSLAANSSSNRRKKPDLPAFDKRHIAIWIKRVESAYEREGIVSPEDKFSHQT